MRKDIVQTILGNGNPLMSLVVMSSDLVVHDVLWRIKVGSVKDSGNDRENESDDSLLEGGQSVHPGSLDDDDGRRGGDVMSGALISFQEMSLLSVDGQGGSRFLGDVRLDKEVQSQGSTAKDDSQIVEDWLGNCLLMQAKETKGSTAPSSQKIGKSPYEHSQRKSDALDDGNR